MAPPNIAHQTPVPQTAEQMFHPRRIISMDIVIFLLPLCEVIAPDGRYIGLYAAFVSASIGTKFKIFEMPPGPLWTFAKR